MPWRRRSSCALEALCRAELQLAILELRRAGLLELRQKIWGEQLYQIPPQQLAAVQQECFSCKPESLNSGRVEVTWPAEAGLAAQLFRTLVFMRQEGLPLTGKGAVHKKHSGRLAAQLPVKDKHLRGLFPSTPADETVPLTVTVLLDLMLALELAERGDNAYRLKTEKMNAWLGLAEAQMTEMLYGVILSRYAASEPAQQHFRYLLSSGAFTPGSWYVLRDLMDLMLQSDLTAGKDTEALQPGCIAWLQCMAGFGWCELGTAADSGECCFRWTLYKPVLPAGQQNQDTGNFCAEPGYSAGGAGGGFIVQPDFEVLVPPEVPYRLRWGLAGCAGFLPATTGCGASG